MKKLFLHIFRDLLSIAGILTVYAGLWLAWPPLALIGAGLTCAAAAWLWYRADQELRNQDQEPRTSRRIF